MKRRLAVLSLCMALGIGLLAGAGVSHADDGVAPRLEAATVEQVAHEADRTMLQVNNQTPFIVIIYVGGVRIGWMRPYRTAIIRGLPTGYHRLTAVSQYGTMSWGPRDSWIPGNWNLIY